MQLHMAFRQASRYPCGILQSFEKTSPEDLQPLQICGTMNILRAVGSEASPAWAAPHIHSESTH